MNSDGAFPMEFVRQQMILFRSLFHSQQQYLQEQMTLFAKPRLFIHYQELQLRTMHLWDGQHQVMVHLMIRSV